MKIRAHGKKILMIGMLSVFIFSSVGTVLAEQADMEKHASCPLCGMDRAKFAHSRFYVEYEDGSSFGSCSLHCAAIDMALNIDKTPKSIMVGDYDTKNLIDAEKAYWVIGGEKTGVMTARAKWAFETDDAAKKFMDAYGGTPAAFEDAVKASFEDMYEDIQMIRKKRQMMKMRKVDGK